MLPNAGPPRGPSLLTVPAGDNRERLVCPDCGFIEYENPKIVTGVVCTWEDKFLLCRRAIEPRRTYWTLPAGYLELNETTSEGAAREAWEEAFAQVEIDCLLSLYNIPRISQVQFFYRGTLLNLDVQAGVESLEVGLFTWAEIPWDQLAFPTVHWALQDYAAMRGQTNFAPRTNPPGNYPFSV
ncbi:NUDIX hydrolase [Candidatus Cyanaurora vandensis]|uniref:NUDIX hydrolase n=1 Tax=Candidatus Cyanaurora vandensis TaxID=2714958 RepID=UPI00257971C0|nr:NUDIX hydrolase [Candidatus Cyanaurora vandensis]